MRISDQLLTNHFLTGINQIKSEMQKTENEVLTQSKINKPSDSPSGIVKALRIQQQLNSHKDYTANIDDSLSFMTTSTSTLESMQTEITNLQVMVTDINNASIDGNSLDSFSQQVDLAINTLLGLANTQYDNKYVFGGTDFSQAPYGYNTANTAIEQKVTSTAGDMKVRINNNTVQKINSSGQDLFGTINGNDVLNTLVTIRDNLKAGTKPTVAQSKVLEDFQKKLTSQLTFNGEVTNRLSATKDMLSSQDLELQDLLEKVAGVDNAKAAIELQNQKYYLDLSYKMSSMILPQSILDYL